MTEHIVIGRIGILLKCRRETPGEVRVHTVEDDRENGHVAEYQCGGSDASPHQCSEKQRENFDVRSRSLPSEKFRPNLEVLQLCVRRSWNTIYPVGVAKPKGAFVGCVMCGEMGDSGEGKISSKHTVFSEG
jgi:hypothetical protein